MLNKKKKELSRYEEIEMEYFNLDMKMRIGVMGSAGGAISKKAKEKVFRLGQTIAEHDCILITGACPGLPYETARGTKSANGQVIGISPALSLEEHMVRYNSPAAYHDVLVFTGSGLMGREITNIRTCDIVVIVGGRSGTLGEFSIAYDEGKLIGILLGTGGIADSIDDIVKAIDKKTGSHIIKKSDPAELLDDLLAYYKKYMAKRKNILQTAWRESRRLMDAAL